MRLFFMGQRATHGRERLRSVLVQLLMIVIVALASSGCAENSDSQLEPVTLSQRVVEDGFAGMNARGGVRLFDDAAAFLRALGEDDPGEAAVFHKAGFTRGAVALFGARGGDFGASAVGEFGSPGQAREQADRTMKDIVAALPSNVKLGSLPEVPGSRSFRLTTSESGERLVAAGVVWTDDSLLHSLVVFGAADRIVMDRVFAEAVELHRRAGGHPL